MRPPSCAATPGPTHPLRCGAVRFGGVRPHPGPAPPAAPRRGDPKPRPSVPERVVRGGAGRCGRRVCAGAELRGVPPRSALPVAKGEPCGHRAVRYRCGAASPSRGRPSKAPSPLRFSSRSLKAEAPRTGRGCAGAPGERRAALGPRASQPRGAPSDSGSAATGADVCPTVKR